MTGFRPPKLANYGAEMFVNAMLPSWLLSSYLNSSYN